jgi:hypothetical protein
MTALGTRVLLFCTSSSAYSYPIENENEAKGVFFDNFITLIADVEDKTLLTFSTAIM